MYSVNADTIRLFLHVLAATVWVGGQFTLAGLVPSLRGLSPEAPKTVARAFNRIAWPAFGVLVLTGIWNVVAESDKSDDSAYQTTLVIKIVVVIASGATAWLHTRSRTPRERAVFDQVVAGKLNKQIAGSLQTCVRTVKSDRAHVMQTFRVHTLADLVRVSVELGEPSRAGLAVPA